jgi:hypothetical protein
MTGRDNGDPGRIAVGWDKVILVGSVTKIPTAII